MSGWRCSWAISLRTKHRRTHLGRPPGARAVLQKMHEKIAIAAAVTQGTTISKRNVGLDLDCTRCPYPGKNSVALSQEPLRKSLSANCFGKRLSYMSTPYSVIHSSKFYKILQCSTCSPSTDDDRSHNRLLRVKHRRRCHEMR